MARRENAGTVSTSSTEPCRGEIRMDVEAANDVPDVPVIVFTGAGRAFSDLPAIASPPDLGALGGSGSTRSKGFGSTTR